jgi:hypothetical protein
VIWLTWRQQRLESAMAALALVLAAALLVPLGLHMASVYDSSGVARCIAHAGTGPGCGTAIDSFQHRFEHAGGVVPWLNFLPGLFAVLFTAPLILEFEHGTFLFAWTQSLTRGRWLAIRLLVICVCALAATFALSMLMAWWRAPLDHVQGRMEPNVFDFEGVVPYAYTLFAVALAFALGAFTRRAAVSLGGALLGYFALRISIQYWLREHYVAPLKRIWSVGPGEPANLVRAWTIQSGPVDRLGHPYSNAPLVIAKCTSGPKALIGSCVRSHGLFNSAIYQPASRFWAFQGIEAGIFASLASILLIAAIWWVRKRLA